MSDHKDKAQESTAKERPKKPPGMRNFQKLLRQVVKAPPLREHPLRHRKPLRSGD